MATTSDYEASAPGGDATVYPPIAKPVAAVAEEEPAPQVAAPISPVGAGAGPAPPRRTPSNAGAALKLPPPVAELVNKIETAIGESKFAIVRSPVAAPFTWRNPLVSGALVLAATSVYMAHTLLAYSIAAIAIKLLLGALVVTGGLKAYSFFATAGAAGSATASASASGTGSAAPGLRLPTVAVPVSSDAIDAAARAIADGLKAAKTSIDSWLSWADITASLRALAYVWLASRYTFLMSPGWMYMGVLAAFIITPAYLLNRAAIDGIIGSAIVPQARSASTSLSALHKQLRDQARDNHLVVTVVGVGITFAAVYTLWDHVNMSTWFSLVAYLLAAADVVHAVGSQHQATPKDA